MEFVVADSVPTYWKEKKKIRRNISDSPHAQKHPRVPPTHAVLEKMNAQVGTGFRLRSRSSFTVSKGINAEINKI